MKEASTADKSVDDCDNPPKTCPENAKNKPKKGESKEVEGTNGHDEKENRSGPPKMNAFQFMMNSRHKSIGSNSPGREADLSASPDSVVSKEELKLRKSRLESWSEQKGASKRKREYEETGNYIDYKLEKRKKKLKRILNIDCQSDDEVIRTRKKRCAVIESDGENSNDVKENVKKERRNKLSLDKTIKSDGIEKELKLTPKSVKSWKFKIKLSMDQNKEAETTSEDLVSNENEKVESPKEANKDLSLDECAVVNEEKPPENGTSVEKRSLRTRKAKPKMDFVYSDSDEEKEMFRKKKKGTVKVAPVFLKAAPKAKLDPKVAEARRQFLLSGVPSSLKKEMEKQLCVEDVEFDVFPMVSHVQQKSDNVFWDLPKPELNLTHQEETKIAVAPFSKNILSLEPLATEHSDAEETGLNKIKNCKKIIKEIKTQNPDYPVYKVFNSIYSKSGYKVETAPESVAQTTTKRRGRPKKNPPEKKPETQTQQQENTTMWTEKYKPKSSADIIGNRSSVTSLKEFLSKWSKDSSKIRKKCDSESEFDVTDDSCDSTKMHSNTILLQGPSGSGKTASVYAVCNELGFNVLEVNASSRRTGKRLLQEVQEATQSHQVCKNDTLLSSFVKEKNKKPSAKMCVLLIEDVDVVFEQDEGFIAAIAQIVTTSKRPIILTATDEPPSSLQKIVNNHAAIYFAPFSSILTIWLQIVCLVEGLYIVPKSLDDLLSYNRGDIRRTLLQLQLFVSSGGRRAHTEIKTDIDVFVDGDDKIDDDNSNLSLLKMDESSDCKEGGQIYHDCQSFSLSYCNNLDVIWWNLPTMLTLPNFSKTTLAESHDSKDKEKLKMLSDCYDSLAFADVLCGKGQFHESLERKWRTKEKDGVGLEENMAEFTPHDVSNDVVQTLISGRVKLYKEKYSRQEVALNMAVPHQTERRWRSKQFASEKKLQAALPLSESLARRAIALDYMPCLRTIARLEFERAANNTKRGNRFYNYLRNLGVRCGDTTYRVACDVFKTQDQ
ncbi:hypothetical protein Zmor_022562 [Zophobas morio]|uniref:AAA+ ATPase domain-containing protein n=1 Tax=Zophobas morio TaxID=2755281 RepID=A0AA38HXT8_9CUCU|nr:hypothetical protein Zmor_022562 [Zophobas morio]